MEDVLWGYRTQPKRRWDTMRNHSAFTFRPSARHGACSVCATWLNSVPSATTKAPWSNRGDQARAKTMRRGAKEQTRINSPFSQDHTHTNRHRKKGGTGKKRDSKEKWGTFPPLICYFQVQLVRGMDEVMTQKSNKRMRKEKLPYVTACTPLKKKQARRSR